MLEGSPARRNIEVARLIVVSVCLAACASIGATARAETGGAAPAGVQAPPGPAAGSGAPVATPAEVGSTLSLTVSDAVLMALENNRSLIVQRMAPSISRTAEQQQRAAFDPDLTGQLSFSRAKSRRPGAPVSSRSQDISVEAGIQEFLPTGTLLDLSANTVITQVPPSEPSEYTSSVAFSADQPLLRGAGLDVNLASLRQARIDILSSEYELRGFAESLVAQTEETYWNYALAERQMAIFQQSLTIAQQQLDETNERIRVGKLAPTESAAAEAEVALRREDLISGRNAVETTRLQLLRLVSPSGADALGRGLSIEDQPSAAEIPHAELADHIAYALARRPDLNQARLQVNRGDLDVVKTRNGLLPRMDLFINLGKTGYAGSFGQSVENLGTDNNYTFSAGLNAEYPILNRSARAGYTRSVIGRAQALESVSNLEQLVEVDVRTAYIAITLAKERVAATAATRKLQEEKLRAEIEKFRVGKSTTLLVGQAQRDLLQSQINEIQAVINHLNAFVELCRLEGSLLIRRGISCPGTEAVKMPSGEPTAAPKQYLERIGPQ